MFFKKEFDIDKDFFTEKPKKPVKRKIAFFVFLFVLFITFSLLCYCAFSFNFNMRFGNKDFKVVQGGLKEAQEYYFDAVKYYEEGEYDKALELLNKQLSIVDDPDAYNYLAKIYQEKEETTLAIQNYEKAIEFKPDFYEANLELGKIYYSLNNFKMASKYLTKASTLHIDDIDTLNLTAETYKMTGHADDAILLFKRILEIQPSNSFANAKIGEIYFQRMDYKNAIQYFEDAIQSSYDEDTAILLAKSYFEIGNYVSAKDVINEILSGNKDNKKAQALKKAIEYKTLNQEIKKETPALKKETAPIMDKDALSKYISEIELSIKTNWAPPIGSNLKKASVKFSIDKKGELVSNEIYKTSGMVEFDKSALDAIENSKPYPPIPDSLNREVLDIIFTFDFNIK